MEIERSCEEWAENGAHKAGVSIAAERKKWQAQGKELSAQAATQTTQTDPTPILLPTVVEKTEVGIERLESAVEWKRKQKDKAKRRARIAKMLLEG